MSDEVLTVDHLRLITSPHYRASIKAALALQEPGVNVMRVTHEHDDSCCGFEPWPETLKGIAPPRTLHLDVESG